jgi:hypothetical protein
MGLAWLPTQWKSDNHDWRIRAGDWGGGRLLVGWKHERAGLFIPVWEGPLEKLPLVTVLAKKWNRLERMLGEWEHRSCAGGGAGGSAGGSEGEVDRALVRAACYWLAGELLPARLAGELLRELIVERPLRLMGLTVLEALQRVQFRFLTERQVREERRRLEVWLALARAWVEEWPPERERAKEWEGYDAG